MESLWLYNVPTEQLSLSDATLLSLSKNLAGFAFIGIQA